MLYFPKVRAIASLEVPIALNAVVDAEGAALVADHTNGVFGAKKSAGAGTDEFLGVSISQEMPLLAVPKVEEAVQPDTDVIQLARTPISGTILVYDVTAGAALVVTTDYVLSGKTLTLESDTAGHVIRVYYKFAPTVIEATAIQGDIYPGGAAGTRYGQVGIIKSGPVYTTEFDSSVNWGVTAPVVKTGANGQFTIGGSGVNVPATVIQVPSTDSPYLGLLLSAA